MGVVRVSGCDSVMAVLWFISSYLWSFSHLHFSLDNSSMFTGFNVWYKYLRSPIYLNLLCYAWFFQNVPACYLIHLGSATCGFILIEVLSCSLLLIYSANWSHLVCEYVTVLYQAEKRFYRQISKTKNS